MCLPTAVSIISSTCAAGKTRNVALGALGCGQPIGFQLGLVLGGVSVQTHLKWRFPFSLCGGLTFALFALSLSLLSADEPCTRPIVKALAVDVDWVSVCISSVGLGCLSYVLA